ncbi:iron complex outermembrane recepter protein [Chitinophaga rupis]|uniref:Iron complex outermembrane recepter protein n=2 Tax=Chitinophaga rupis TaxID=573321 RepID=A0A1H8GLD8_9BACT|nr:iron complex outermembrane recepter protein [Chitinophaga rupis]
MNLIAYRKTGRLGPALHGLIRSRLLSKTLLVMKLTTILILAALLQVSAKGVAQKISLKAKNAPLVKVLSEIERQSGYSFWYRSSLLKNVDKISIELKDVNIDEALKKCLNSQGFEYIIVDHTIIIKLPGEKTDYQAPLPPAHIKGKVTAADGTPLIGVSVLVKNTQRGTTTDANGEFSISVNKGEVLVFSYVGYDPKELAFNDQPFVAVNLAESKVTLSDFVVVGYGKQNRAALTSAISTVKAEDLNRGAISDVGQLLQGKVPGLNISASGDPNKPAAVVMRGASTINSSQTPFYVIDGIPGADISVIAPDDIASIDVLKDAAATAIYGNRGANGVIMVTTRKGRSGQMQVGYNSYIGLEKVSNKLDMMDAGQLRDFLKKNNLAFSPADDKGANTDWQSSIQRSSAVSHNHNLSFSGGGEHGNYIASVNYMRKEGILTSSSLERVIARMAVEQYALNDKVKFGLTVTNSHTNSDDIAYRNTVLLQSALYLPVSPIKNADGTYFENFQNQNYYNPVAMLDNSQVNNKNNTLVGSFTTQVKLPFGFTYDMNLAYQSTSLLYGAYYNKYFTDHYTNMYDNPDPGLGAHSQQTFGTNGQAVRSSFQNTSKLLETYLTWDRKFGDHNINAVLGYSWQNFVNGDGFQASTSNFPVDNIAYRNFALSNPYAVSSYRIDFGPNGVYQETRLISDFARLNYNFKDKYLLQGSIRRDGSSVFGTDHQWGYFPSVGAAWRISNEAFMDKQQIFTSLKLRASYGVTGNATGFNAYTARLISGSLGTYYYNGVLVAAYGPTQADNPDLRWEKTATTNIGIDFAILKGKLSGTLEWYNKNTTGMIYPYRVDPQLVPAGTITANGGSMNNKGIELGLSATPVQTKNFSWTSNLNLAHNTNKITSLKNPLFTGGDSLAVSYPEGGGQSGSSLQLLKSGKPLGQFFTLEYAGKNADGVSQYVGGDGKLTTSPSNGTDYHYMGSAQPKLLAGWSNSFHYKDFDLNIFIRGVFGNKIFNATRADLFRPTTAQYSNILVDAGNESIADVNAYRYSSRFIESGSYVRFDNATLGYNFKNPGRYIKNIRLYTSVNNLFVITKFKGVDPEVNQGGIAPGVDYNNFYPKTRTFLFGLNAAF